MIGVSRRFAVVTSLMLWLTACMASSNSYQTARVARRGAVHVGAALHTSYVDEICGRFDTQQTAELRRACLGFEGTETVAERLWVPPMPEVFVRYGVAKDLDIGARVTLIGAELDVKYQLVAARYVDLSVGLRGRALYSGASIFEGGGGFPILMSLRPAKWFAVTAGTQSLLSGWRPIFASWSNEGTILALGVAGVTNLSFEFEDFFIRPEATYNYYPITLAEPDYVHDISISYLTLGIGLGLVIE